MQLHVSCDSAFAWAELHAAVVFAIAHVAQQSVLLVMLAESPWHCCRQLNCCAACGACMHGCTLHVLAMQHWLGWACEWHAFQGLQV